MAATIIDGKTIAARIRAEIGARVTEMEEKYSVGPGLAAVLIGDNPASHQYVSMKGKACGEAGIESFGLELPADVSQAEVEALIRQLNERSDVNGILVQLQLPPHLDESRILNLVSLEKDVDGFHPINIGRLAQRGREPLFVSATPAGIIRLLEEVNVEFAGANAVVLGRSNIVGMPVALLLIRRDATVTVCHSRTRDLPCVGRQADILVAAVGRVQNGEGGRNQTRAGGDDLGTKK